MSRNKPDSEFVFNELEKMFPQAHCELNYRNIFQLTLAVVLSAQTTDVSVNRVTPELFDRYPSAELLAEARPSDVEAIIKSIGLYRNKSRNIIALSKELLIRHNGIVPDKMEELLQLPGIGRKTANVILSEGYKQPAIAVDTHVSRVSQRLGLVKKGASAEETERELMKIFPKEKWSRLHHLLIFFGRYKCSSQRPDCRHCPLTAICSYDKKGN